MAILTDANVKEIWLSLYRKGEGKEEIKADGLPSRAERKAIFQAFEDWFETQRAPLKGRINTAAGRTVSNAVAKKYGRAWLRYKWGKE